MYTRNYCFHFSWINLIWNDLQWWMCYIWIVNPNAHQWSDWLVANGLLLGLNLCQSKETTSWIYTGFIIGFQVRPQRTKDAVTVFGVSCGRKLMTVPMAEFTRHGRILQHRDFWRAWLSHLIIPLYLNHCFQMWYGSVAIGTNHHKCNLWWSNQKLYDTNTRHFNITKPVMFQFYKALNSSVFLLLMKFYCFTSLLESNIEPKSVVP